MSQPGMRYFYLYPLALLALLPLCACKADTIEPRTEVLVQIDAEPLVRLTADRLLVEIASGPRDASSLTQAEPEQFEVKGADSWPFALALVAQPGHEDWVFEVAIHIENKGKRVARSRLKSSFLKHQTLLLRTLLYGECLNKLDCGDEQTCVAPLGKPRCDSAAVDPTSLPAFTPGGGAGELAVDAGEPGRTGGAGAGGALGLGGSGGTSVAGSGGRAVAGSDGSGTVYAGGSGGAGGGTPVLCEKRGAEQCDNGIDDDCNGTLDCADPACNAVMSCVPASPTLGVLVPQDVSCPSGYNKTELLVHRGVIDPGCGGCACQPSPTVCKPEVFFYSDSSGCGTAFPPLSGGTSAGYAPAQCGSTPIITGSPTGWRVAISKSDDACSATGTATRLPASWSTTMKLCVAAAPKRGGCDAGYACLPRVNTGKLCAQRELAVCPSPSKLEIWARDLADDRTCGACGCAAQGGSCADLVVHLGHDYSCDLIDGTLRDGEKSCMLGTYSPPAWSEGKPKDPTCTAGAQVIGTVKPSLPIEMCCLD